MKTSVVAVTSLGLMLLTGCLFGGTSKESVSGQFVPAATFAQIEPGKTSGDYVLATLGPPTAKTPVNDGSEIWRYSYTEQKRSSGYVFLVFGGSNEKSLQRNAYVSVKDNVVLKAWRD
jgi:outer membrane protein assembly factor BamE (lipoprotein component of BamABCDE complex)